MTVVDIRRMHRHPQQRALRIDHDMALTAFHLLVGIIAAWPPFSVVLTLWLSIIAALGSGLRPCLMRQSARNPSLIRSHSPLAVHARKYVYTVCHLGKSCGNIRHEQPVRSTYKMAFTISRRSTLRGRPPALAAGR